RTAATGASGEPAVARSERDRVPLGPMSGEAWRFIHSDEIRFGDLDVLGHLNNVGFLVLIEDARVAYLQTLIPGRNPTRTDDFGVLVAEVKISYRSPGLL